MTAVEPRPPFRSVLVHVDPVAPVQPAVARAVEVAARHGASVRLVDVVEGVPRHARLYLSDEMQRLVTQDHARKLEALANSARRHDVPVSADVLSGQPAVTIVREVLRRQHDLVLRSHTQVPRSKAFGSIDMQLLRKCPCPVWLVTPGAGRRRRRIVAAVNPDPSDQEHQALNEEIVKLAMAVRDDRGELVILHAWMPFGADVLRSHMKPAELKDYVKNAEDLAAAALDDLVERFGPGLKGVHTRLVKGVAERAIPRFVRANRVDLVVMGTVARTGISGLIMGNTAERVLSALRCSVLTTKTAGFVCPVSLD